MARQPHPSNWPTEQLVAVPPGTPATWWIWCGQRPWLAGLVTLAAGLTITLVPNADVSVVILPGVAGLSGLVLGSLIFVAGLFLIFSPQIHGLIGIAVVLLSLVSFISTNLGGLLVGMILGIFGGSLGFGWQPPDRHPT
jgi:hypothetical protein